MTTLTPNPSPARSGREKGDALESPVLNLANQAFGA